LTPPRRRGIRAVIPRRRGPPGRTANFNRQTCRERNVIERCAHFLGRRSEKTAVNFLTVVRLAIIHRYLKIGVRDRT